MLVTRDKRLDIIKGIAILLVVIGHNIQMLKGAEYTQGLFFENSIFSVIYTFHMPVFMLISGYLIHGSVNKYAIKTIISKRIKSLIIPIVFWTLLVMLLYMFFDGATFNLVNFIFDVLNSLWFLWAVFYCTIGLIIGNKFFNDSVVFHIVVVLVLLLTPNLFNKDLYAFMYPYFIIGYYAKKHKFNIKKINIFGAVCAFVLLFYFWDTDKYIYTTGLTLIGKVNPINVFLIDMYRWMIGILGSLIIVKVVDVMYNKFKSGFSLLTDLGKKSLGIYIVNIYVSNYLLTNVTVFESWDELSYTLICIVLSPVITGLCLIVVNLIEKSKLLNALLLGGGFKLKSNSVKLQSDKTA